MVIGQSFIDTRNESHETDASVVADSFTSESLILTETIDVYPETKKTSTDDTYVNMITPTSARHKRGCNCKRSKCTKNTVNVFNLVIPTV
ncbi:hypothetical protein MTR_2g036100 [Medicago truncatula]|uniref:Uncharacterized protein n=1 Tax=Medicago truncatula TaxID=3880 RepID=G7IG30_MEDTR|nr:hypothetical protein MTR_2g036100 [Medicago truncatula]